MWRELPLPSRPERRMAVRDALTVCPARMALIFRDFRIWNDLAMYGNEEITRQNYFKYLPEAERADKCKACGKCEKVCPQSIKISHTMTEIAKIFAK